MLVLSRKNQERLFLGHNQEIVITVVEIRDGKITREQILDRMHHNPARIFNVPTDETTKVHVSMEEYEITVADEANRARRKSWLMVGARFGSGSVGQMISTAIL